MPQAYGFLDFVLKPEELSLFHKNQRLELGLKGFKLLVALVENQGKLVPKDELIAAAWGEQIVTDGTLSKQMERIRQVLGENHPDITFVETVRGIGYKFIPVVKTHIDRKKGLAKWQKAIASVSIIPLVLFLYFYPFNNSDRTKEEYLMPFNIAIIPTAQGDSYMNVGGLNYLSNLLDKNPRILTLAPESSWFENKQKKQLAIEIKSQKNLDYVLLVNITESNDGKSAQLELKNNNQFSKKVILNASSFKQLFAEINTWTSKILKLKDSKNSHLFNKHLSGDNFAVESFLRGMSEQMKRKHSKAIQYFQMAITQDEKFDLARIKEIESLIFTNNYNSAEAKIFIIEKNKNLDIDLSLFLKLLKANILVFTNKLTNVEELLVTTIEYAKNKHYTSVLTKALHLQGMMYFQLGQSDKALESYLLRSKYINSTSKNPRKIAIAANGLAIAYLDNYQPIKAQEQINKAILTFEKINLIEGMFDSYDTLARILYDLAQFQQTKVTIDKGMSIKEKIDNKRFVLWFLQTVAYLQIENGNHNQALNTMKEIESISGNLKMAEAEILALDIQFELAIRRKDSGKINQIYTLFLTKGEKIQQNLPNRWKSMMVKLISANIELRKYDLVQQQIIKLQNLLRETSDPIHDELNTLIALWMFKTGQVKESILLLDNQLNKSLEDRKLRTALVLAYIRLDIAIEQNNYDNVQAVINQIAFIKPFPYPYLKYKAKLAAHNGDYFEASTLMQ